MSSCKVLQTDVAASDLERQLKADMKKQSQLSKDGLTMECPSWLNQEYMEQCLRSHYNDNELEILKFQATPCLGKGENYLGVLTRVKVEFLLPSKNVTETRSYVVKSMLQDKIFDEVYGSDVFLCEMIMYEKVIPKLKTLLSDINETEEIFARTVAVDRRRSCLIFEDLNERNYFTVDRLKGLNREIVELMLRKLAKMHAASAVLNERESGYLESFQRGLVSRHNDKNYSVVTGMFDACKKFVAQSPGFQDISQKLEKLKDNYMELCLRVFDPMPNHLNVLNHGDLWSTNIMVKYDPVSGKPLDMIIIDYQFVVWGSPGIDLWYNFNTSLEEDLHLNKQDELIQNYYYTLSDTLKKLSFQGHIPTLHEFHLQLEEKAFYRLHSTCFIQPIHRCIDTGDADFATLIKNTKHAMQFKESCYTKNPYCQRIIRHLLPKFERKGLLCLNQ
ncbi:uncharacterized protein LOC119639634 [Glossina fuscipes]|uniref:Uncharacterized protein LOC119639634 n=1 Tax=Glossina fuscipes TaxID=7396 RepID=A0A9C5Z340_9MUSC|nr:uncharacterized protein LOC119639634 [Glossina fuscipes]KAI9579895.1 hypothetical protein GQX74_000683 [Glossina fuscipes]